MTEKSADRIDEATTRILDLEAELEASGTMTREAAALARARTLLHEWVDSVTAVVATPGVGRVVLIHENGAESRIASPELPFRSRSAAETKRRTDPAGQCRRMTSRKASP